MWGCRPCPLCVPSASPAGTTAGGFLGAGTGGHGGDGGVPGRLSPPRDPAGVPTVSPRAALVSPLTPRAPVAVRMPLICVPVSPCRGPVSPCRVPKPVPHPSPMAPLPHPGRRVPVPPPAPRCPQGVTRWQRARGPPRGLALPVPSRGVPAVSPPRPRRVPGTRCVPGHACATGRGGVCGGTGGVLETGTRVCPSVAVPGTRVHRGVEHACTRDGPRVCHVSARVVLVHACALAPGHRHTRVLRAGA